MRFRLSPTRFEGPFSNQGKFVKWPQMGHFAFLSRLARAKAQSNYGEGVFFVGQ